MFFLDGEVGLQDSGSLAMLLIPKGMTTYKIGRVKKDDKNANDENRHSTSELERNETEQAKVMVEKKCAVVSSRRKKSGKKYSRKRKRRNTKGSEKVVGGNATWCEVRETGVGGEGKENGGGNNQQKEGSKNAGTGDGHGGGDSGNRDNDRNGRGSDDGQGSGGGGEGGGGSGDGRRGGDGHGAGERRGKDDDSNNDSNEEKSEEKDEESKENEVADKKVDHDDDSAEEVTATETNTVEGEDIGSDSEGLDEHVIGGRDRGVRLIQGSDRRHLRGMVTDRGIVEIVEDQESRRGIRRGRGARTKDVEQENVTSSDANTPNIEELISKLQKDQLKYRGRWRHKRGGGMVTEAARSLNYSHMEGKQIISGQHGSLGDMTIEEALGLVS